MLSTEPRGSNANPLTAELAASASLLHATLESAPDAIVVINLQHRAIVWNARYARLVELPADVMASRDIREWARRFELRLAEPKRFRREYDAALARPEQTLTQQVTLLDGRILERYASPQYVHGLCVGSVVHWRDVTERWRAEQALRRSEIELRLAQRVAQVGSWQWATDTGAVHWSAQMYRIFRRRPAQGPISYAGMAAVLSAESFGLLEGSVAEAVRHGTPWGIDLEILRGDGHRGWINARAVVERNAEGVVTLLRGSAHDITESRRAQQDLLQSQQRLQALFDHALNAIVLAGDDSCAIDVNPAACALFGRPREALLGVALADLMIAPPGAAASIGDAWRRFLSERRQTARVQLARPEGAVVDVEYSAVAGVQPGVHLLIMSDVTEQRRAREMRVARDAAEAANRSKSDFVSRMSHELRTPLNAILGFSEVLLLGAAEPLGSRQHDHVGRIRHAGTHLLALIEDLLDVSRMEAGSMRLDLESVDVAQIVREAMKSLEAQADGQGVHLVVAVETRQTRVLGDRTRLRQVMLNLISNAIKYNRPGGRVWARVDAAGERIRIRIADEGLGMTAQQLGRLFAPFERLGREYSSVAGTGIGLVITRKLVEMMGGSLAVESVAGAGSSFIVGLAAAACAQASMPAPLGAIGGEGATAQARLLYFDDDEVNRLLMQAYCALRPGYRLTLAADGASGLAAALGGGFDAVLVDMRLPDMSGIDIVRALRRQGGLRTPSIGVSADAMPEQIAEALGAGFDEYLTKPVSVAALFGAIERVVGAGAKPTAPLPLT